MVKILQISNEPRFVRALALALDPGDTLSFLLETGAFDSQDPSLGLGASVSIVRRTREVLSPAYDRASERQDWEQVHTIGVLQQALATPDSAAYLAYHTHGFHSSEAADRFADALAIIGCAADTMCFSRRRPWSIETNDLSLLHWREQVWRLLLDMPGNALPRPAACTCSEPGSPKSLAGDHADWCPPASGGERP